jgi:hypothetical protein
MPRSARITPIMTTTMPIVQRMAMPVTKPITRRRIPRIIMRELLAAVRYGEERDSGIHLGDDADGGLPSAG